MINSTSISKAFLCAVLPMRRRCRTSWSIMQA